MKYNKLHKTLLGFMLIMLSCQPVANIPKAYDFSLKEAKYNPFGCWTVIACRNTTSISTSAIGWSGELLTIDNDNIYLLIEDGKVHKLKSGNVESLELYTHKNQAGNYLGMTGLFLVPSVIGAMAHSDYAGSFLALGIPVTVFGSIQTIVESRGNKAVLKYPSKVSLDEIKKFARYPAGLPATIDFTQLYLKK